MAGNRYPLEIQPAIPPALSRLQDLAGNLFYAWQAHRVAKRDGRHEKPRPSQRAPNVNLMGIRHDSTFSRRRRVPATIFRANVMAWTKPAE
jgi:hypothetical protein